MPIRGFIHSLALVACCLCTASVLTGCSQSSDPQKSATSEPRTIKMDDASLFVSGDRWVYSYPTDAGICHIVGDHVEFLGPKADHIVVGLDQTLELKVPTSGSNYLVGTNGFRDIPGDFSGRTVNEEMIVDAIAAVSK